MINKRKVTKEHIPPNYEPIVLSLGEVVDVGREDLGNPKWRNWVWSISKSSNLAGWVPKQYLSIEGDIGTATKEYSASELSVKPGEELDIKYYLNGWVWCSNESGNYGWVPEENLNT